VGGLILRNAEEVRRPAVAAAGPSTHQRDEQAKQQPRSPPAARTGAEQKAENRQHDLLVRVWSQRLKAGKAPPTKVAMV